jgi:hypothetical protein
LPVDDEGLGRAGGSVGEVRLLGVVADDCHVCEVIVDDVLAIGRIVGIEADGEYDEVGDLSLKLHEGGEFLFAGRTPGGPEIQDHDFAAVLIEAYGLSRIMNGEGWCDLIDLCGMRAAVASCGEAAQEEKGTEGFWESTAHVSIIKGNYRERLF